LNAVDIELKKFEVRVRRRRRARVRMDAGDQKQNENERTRANVVSGEERRTGSPVSTGGKHPTGRG
jgi:hypothetical protein